MTSLRRETHAQAPSSAEPPVPRPAPRQPPGTRAAPEPSAPGRDLPGVPEGRIIPEDSLADFQVNWQAVAEALHGG